MALAVRRQDAGWLYSLGLHLMAALVLLWLGRALRTVPEPEKPVIPIVVVAEDAGPGGGMAAPKPVLRDQTPRPATVRPDAPRPVVDPMDAQLAALAQLRSADGGTAQGAGTGGSGGGYTIRDLVRAQILRHWGVDARTAPLDVALHIVIGRNGVLLRVEVANQIRFEGDAIFRDVAISARNAATLSSPFELPPDVPPSALDFTITVNARAALR